MDPGPIEFKFFDSHIERSDRAVGDAAAASTSEGETAVERNSGERLVF